MFPCCLSQVKCVVETRDAEQGQELEKIIRERYEHVVWGPKY